MLRRLATLAMEMNSGLLVGSAIVGFYLLLALIGPLLVPYDPLKQDLTQAVTGISFRHPLGTDDFGRDVATRILYGARLSLGIVLTVTFAATTIGVAIGLVSGSVGGLLDLLLMRLIDVLIAFPGLLLALLIISILGGTIPNMMIAVTIFLIPSFARISRAAALRVRSAEFIQAARVIGCTGRRIISRHILPSCLTPILVQLTIEMGTAVLSVSALSFLGLGVQRPQPEWGLMLSDGREYLQAAPHMALAPGFAIMFLVLGFNLLGDGLRDALDPARSSVATFR